MAEFALYLLLSVLFLLLGYLVTVYSNAIYIDPDEIRTIFPDLSPRRRRQLEQFTANPRAFVQTAFPVRLSSAVALGIFSLLAAQRLADLVRVPRAVVLVVIITGFWMVAMLMFIYLPRRISLPRAKTGLVRFLPLMRVIYLVSSPVIRRLTAIAARRTGEQVSEEQKEDIVERAIESLAESAGIRSPIIEADEKEMIHQIFQLDVTEVEEIMVPRVNVVAIEQGTGLGRIQQVFQEHGYSRYPVYEETIDNVVGVLYVKDLLSLTDEKRSDFRLVDHMREPVRVGEHKKIDQLLAEFKLTKVHMAIVIDDFGGTAGLVTLEDILEEIVGEIEDEHDAESDRAIIRHADGAWEVSGAVSLEDLADELGIELQVQDFQTVGGMIYDLVGSVPVEGTVLSWRNYKMKVLAVSGQRIVKVMVVPPDSAR